MNNLKRLFLKTSWLLFSGLSVVMGTTVSPGKIILYGVPAGSAVFINDSLYRADHEHWVLNPGSYRIIVNPPYPADYRYIGFDTTVSLDEGELLHIRCRFQKRIRIESQPPGAEIYKDQKKVGYTPFWIYYDEPSEFQLVLKNHPPQRITIDDSVFHTGFVSVRFTEAPQNSNLFKNPRWLKRGEKKYQWPLATSISLAVVSGGYSAYAKKKADRYFEKAKIAHRFLDHEKRLYYEKKTKRYDRKATVGFIGLQINMLASVYFIFQMN